MNPRVYVLLTNSFVERRSARGERRSQLTLLLQRLRVAPDVATLRQQFFRGNRSPRSRRVKFATGQRFAFPAGANGIHNLPRGFHLVAADEQRGVAGAGFPQQPFKSHVAD